MPPQQPQSPIQMPHYEDQQPPRPSRRRHEGIRTFFSTLSVIVLAIGFAVLLTTYVFQSYQVDGPSMEPTLHDNDRLVIWKVPRTLARLTGHTYMPERGDIIVFSERGMLGPDGQTKQLIKRVIGLPGDRVVIADGLVTVYNNEHPDGFNPDMTLAYGDGKPFLINNNEEMEEYVDDGELFVMGDNRNNSLDSRTIGAIDAGDVVGKLSIRIFPLDDARSF